MACKPVLHKIRKPSKTPTILALATTTPATPPEIADAVKVSRQAVYEVLNRYGIEANTLDNYKKHRADIIAAAQEKDLKVYLELTPEERKSHVQKRGLIDYGILYDKERLELDKSTLNVQPMVSFRQREDGTDPPECPTGDDKDVSDSKTRGNNE